MTKVKATIEIPKNCCNKYEIDKATGMLKLDRKIKLVYPFAYGFINNTLAPDGDALDCFVVEEHHTLFPLDEIEASIYGAFICFDEGISDDKLVLINNSTEIDDINTKRIYCYNFLKNYKKGFEVAKFVDAEDAIKIYKKCKL